MPFLNDLRNLANNYSWKTMGVLGLMAGAFVGSYYGGKYRQRVQTRGSPIISDCEIVNGMAGFETVPALVIHRIDGASKGSPYINGKFRTLTGLMSDKGNWDSQASDYSNSSQQSQRGQLKPLSINELLKPYPSQQSSSAAVQTRTSTDIPTLTIPSAQPYVPAQPTAPPSSGPALPPISPAQPTLPPASTPAQPAPAQHTRQSITPSSLSNYEQRTITPRSDRTVYNNRSELERRAEVEHAPSVSGLVPVIRPNSR